MTSSLNQFARAKLEQLAEAHLRRELAETHRIDGITAERDGRTLISFCCNDYLNLSLDPAVKAAAVRATEELGVGAGASRLVTGNHPLYARLESRLAAFKGTEAACVFGSGFLANAGIPPALVGREDLVLIDELGHASMNIGARLTRAKVARFRHNDVDHCREILRAERGNHSRCLVMTEGAFSMDGDRAPLDALAVLAGEYDAWLLCDDAHGFGVLGGGRGSAYEFDPPVDIPLAMGTLSKAAGGYGGYLCASRPVIELVGTRVRSLVYTTGLPPAVVAGALAALDIIETDAARVAAPLAAARRFTASLNLPQAESAIVPLVVGDSVRALDASRALAREGFLVAAIRPPTVPEGTARLRFTFTAGHDAGMIDGLVSAVRQLGVPG